MSESCPVDHALLLWHSPSPPHTHNSFLSTREVLNRLSIMLDWLGVRLTKGALVHLPVNLEWAGHYFVIKTSNFWCPKIRMSLTYWRVVNFHGIRCRDEILLLQIAVQTIIPRWWVRSFVAPFPRLLRREICLLICNLLTKEFFKHSKIQFLQIYRVGATLFSGGDVYVSMAL